jgi:hypothetical protein
MKIKYVTILKNREITEKSKRHFKNERKKMVKNAGKTPNCEREITKMTKITKMRQKHRRESKTLG